jgi:enoyl-CoA hydratase/carnithine racemase
MTSKICRDCRCTPAAAERGLLVSIWAMRASALWRSSKTIVLYERCPSVERAQTPWTNPGSARTPVWRSWISIGHRVFDRLAHLPQPTIAVVDGLAVGGGLELALACDLRVTQPNARFGLPETGLGTIPGWGGTDRLTRLVGPSRAKELILTRRQIDATTALHWGLVNDIADATLETAVDRYVTDLLGSAPIAQQVAKQLIDAAAAGVPSSILESISSGFTAYTNDYTAGVHAFMNKTQAHFDST